MEWVMRQSCFFIFIVAVGGLLHAGKEVSWAGLLSAADDSAWEQCKRFSVPVLLYAAAELLCYGRGAAVLLPIRMLSLLYGCCFYVGLFSAVRLLRSKRRHSLAKRFVFPMVCLEATLLGFVLLRDGYCRSSRAAIYGTVGFAAVIFLHLFSAHRIRRMGHCFRSAR